MGGIFRGSWISYVNISWRTFSAPQIETFSHDQSINSLLSDYDELGDLANLVLFIVSQLHTAKFGRQEDKSSSYSVSKEVHVNINIILIHSPACPSETGYIGWKLPQVGSGDMLL